MCTVDKMLIKGIRSFSPDNTAVITFFKPLTLIVGPNGAGKTTIIECLKHACTGELPPNARSGHSFIHDPKVAGETETKGQIKLRFKTAAGKDVVCIRSFQLTQKASKLEYKAIESVLQTINSNTGEKVCLSYRCADMDREVPLLMGVSKAVLENVIFVHQDEANWPLAEGAVLKKKFDDIFSATKYTKALEALKKLHKEQGQLLREYRLKLDHLRTLKDAAHRLQEGVERDSEKAAVLQQQIAQIEAKVAAAEARLGEMEGEMRRVRGMREEVRVREGRRDMLTKQRLERYEALNEEIEESEEVLEKQKEGFEARLASFQLEINGREGLLNELRIELQAEKEALLRDTQSQAKLQAEADSHRNDIRSRDRCLASLFSSHHLGEVGPLPLSEEDAVKASVAAARRVQEMDSNLKRLKDLNKQQDNDLSAAVDAAKSDVVRAEGQLQLSRQRKAESESKVQQLQAEIESAAISEADVRRVEEVENSTKEEMDGASTLLKAKPYEELIERSRGEVFALEGRLKQLQREKDALAAESGERVSLKMKKEALGEKEALLSRLIDDNRARFEAVFNGKVPETKRLTAELDALIRDNKAAYNGMDGRCKAKGNKVAALTMKQTDAQRELSSKTRERDVKRSVLVEGLLSTLNQPADVDTLEQQLLQVKNELNRKNREHDMLDGMRRCFSRFMEMAEEERHCPVCERGFETPADLDNFLQKQRRNQGNSADELLKKSSERSRFEVQLQALEHLQPMYVEYSRLKNETIPKAQEALEKTRAELAKATDEYDDLLATLAHMRAEHEAAERMVSIAAEVERVMREREVLMRDIAAAEYKLQGMADGGRSAADVGNDLAEVEEKRSDAARSMERLRDEFERLKDNFTAWNIRWRNAREEKVAMAHTLMRVKEKRGEKEKLEDQIQQLRLEMQMAERSMEPLRREQQRRTREREELRRRADEEEREKEQSLRELQRDVDQLKTITLKIEQYRLSGKAERLQEASDRIRRSAAKQAAVEQKVNELVVELEGKRELLRKKVGIKRNIEDNLAYKRAEREEQQVKEEVAAMQRELVLVGDLESREREMERMDREIRELQAEQNRSRGTIAAYEGNISHNKAELRAAQFRNIDARYRMQLIQLKTTEMANKDLDKYYHALDRALMRFHSMKMEEINKIIKELWQQTYRGQDIDVIEIRSDSEGAGTRSYSYRVVMRSGDAELDMRGRCSAGQKVLASLIIRLALAETFCLNCGILALDEPTTNLDTPNADSLAAALLRIMEDRRGQENFQLIVITHDERFAHLIGQKEHAERYYRISKDEHQHSKIEAQDIFD